MAVDSGVRFALNEVPIGIPMPAVYVRMLGYAWGERAAARVSLFGEIFDQDQARDLGLVDELAPADRVLDRAVEIADSIPADTLEQYAFTKRATQAAALRDIADLSDPLDSELPRWFTTPDARHAHQRYWRELKGAEPTW